MSKITDFATQEQATLATLKTAMDGVAAGVTALDAKIVDLAAQLGTLTPEEQAALDAVTAASTALVTEASGINTADPTAPVPAA